jgi:hypothetical protein
MGHLPSPPSPGRVTSPDCPSGSGTYEEDLVRRTTVLAASAALSLLLAAGCSSNTPTDTTAGPAATSAPTTVATVPKDKVIEEGDKICKASDDKAGSPKSDSPDDIETFLKDGVKNAREDVKKIKAIGTPDKDADKLTKALDTYVAFLDQLDKKAGDIAKDPSVMKEDTDLTDAQEAAQKAAKDFGFKVCGTSSDDSSDTTTTTKKKSTTTTSSGSSGADTTVAAKFLEGLDPTGTYTDDQVACVAKDIFGDSELRSIATSGSGASVAEREKLYSALVDCVGPTVLIDLFMKGFTSKSTYTAEQEKCVRKVLEGLSQTEGVALVAGDPDAGKAFATQITKECDLA